MPILAEEPALFPDWLLDETSGEPCERRWWVLYTKARQEKALARQMLASKTPFYLPLVKKQILCRGRRFLAHIPVFSGYLFLYGSEPERIRALATHRVVHVIEVPDPDGLRFELRQLRRLIIADAPLTVESRLAAGIRVRVRGGPLMGIEGTVLKRCGQTRLLVAVNFLQRGASVEIEDFLLEPIDEVPVSGRWHSQAG
jgi:transcriptional antiterminator RfaH